MNSKSFPASSYTEDADGWLDDVRVVLNKLLKSKVPADVCVFQVPKSLRTVKPEHYEPQMIGLGPYNHLKPELREMERIKFDAICRLLSVFPLKDFDALTNKLTELNPRVRASYHKNLDGFDESKLAWIMAVDSAFLFYFLCHQTIKTKTLESSQHLKHIAGPVGRKLAEDAILRDVMMLENQVPLFFMKEMLALLWSPRHDGGNKKDVNQKGSSEEIFPLILVSFCKTLSPIEHTPEDLASKALERAHLLDLLHAMVVPREDHISIDITSRNDADQLEAPRENASSAPEKLEQLTTELIMDPMEKSELTEIEHRFVNKLRDSKGLPMENKFKPAAIMMEGLLALQELTELIGSDFFSSPLKVEDFLLPTASRLVEAGVIFEKTDTVQDINFDQTKNTLYLPVIRIGVNTEVIIRNLVAYEAMAMHKSLKFARYVELMNGLIDTVEDVRLLKDRKILKSHMKDHEVMTIFNNASKSIQLSKDEAIDNTTKKLNDFYNESLNIKALKAGKLFVYGFWKTVALVAIIAYLLLMFLSSFCSAYGCNRTSR